MEDKWKIVEHRARMIVVDKHGGIYLGVIMCSRLWTYKQTLPSELYFSRLGETSSALIRSYKFYE